jgi:3alpha(or 20beta)-hydroxysteroid dehydrogenase
MGQLDRKIAVVTGGARGIGEATVRAFVAEGARVVIADLLEDRGRALADELDTAAHFCRLDVSDETNWLKLKAEAETRFGPVNVLVNNAGVGVFSGIDKTSVEAWDRTMAINARGPFLGIKTFALAMVEAGGGSIVNIASNEAFRGTNGMAAYTASKWAATGLTKVAAMEYGHRNVRVNSVHPGGTNTDLANPSGRGEDELKSTYKIQPIQRIGRPQEVAAVCVFLASDAASYVHGAQLAVDGGSSIGRYRDMLDGAPAGGSLPLP